MTGDKDWKNKYFDSLKQLEDSESTWAELETLLRKAISRLAISAKGLDKRMDKVLKDIQKNSRSKKDVALQNDLEDLSKILAQLEDGPDKAGAPATVDDEQDFHNYALKLIQQIRLDKEFKTRLEDFKSSIHSMDNDQCLNELAVLLNQSLDQDSDDKVPVQEVLVTLIEKIAFTHGNSERLSEISEKLDIKFQAENWHDYLDEIINEIRYIIRGINNEKVELEGLIVDVTRQLNEISGVLVDERTDSEEGRNDTLNLQSMMNESVESIQSTVDSASDIEELKISINTNLGSIKLGVEEFVAKEDERYHKTEQRNNQLQQQIQLMEQESEQLKEKLTENRQQLMFDTLTGARSRLSYEEILDQELSRWSRYQEVFSFALLDIDHFKSVNDQFGHNAGDKALQIVAKMMGKHIRETDFLFRIGGEEFVMLLPKTRLENATPLVEKIRTSVSATGFHFKKNNVVITLSGGLTAIRENDTAESIYERADKALYEAKNGGRNQLIVKII